MNTVKLLTEEQEETIAQFKLQYAPLDEGMFTKRIIALESQIRKAFSELAYPNSDQWQYCIPLVANIKINDVFVDLGINMNDRGDVSACIVYSENPGDYGSGDCFWACLWINFSTKSNNSIAVSITSFIS